MKVDGVLIMGLLAFVVWGGLRLGDHYGPGIVDSVARAGNGIAEHFGYMKISGIPEHAPAPPPHDYEPPGP